ncbi:hypothetical protein [Streptomyces sp. NPDC090093]|uniref:hypothetical protein n=1 Tax=Streptomyces sp. NPDC090093 TaxID=3365945 RepID=UPI003815933E
MTNGTAEYRVYDLDAFKRHDFTPVTRFPALHRIQSWCLYGDFVHQNAGDPLEESWWTVYAIASGAVIERTLDTTALHLEHRETEAITVRRTPDGRPRRPPPPDGPHRRAPWTNGQAFLILPPHLRPNRTQSLVGATAGKGDNTGALTVRLEITTDGKPCVFDERGLTGWIGPDAGHFTT